MSCVKWGSNNPLPANFHGLNTPFDTRVNAVDCATHHWIKSPTVARSRSITIRLCSFDPFATDPLPRGSFLSNGVQVRLQRRSLIRLLFTHIVQMVIYNFWSFNSEPRLRSKY